MDGEGKLLLGCGGLIVAAIAVVAICVTALEIAKLFALKH